MKLNPNVPHHQTVMNWDEVSAHFSHIPESKQTTETMHFNRWHFKDEKEAKAFLAALISDGGYGQLIDKSVRACDYWEPKSLALLPMFETGPVELDPSMIPYDNPEEHVETKVRREFAGNFYWLALNAHTVACFDGAAGVPIIEPTPQYRIGFQTQEVLKAAWDYILQEKDQQRYYRAIKEWCTRTDVLAIVTPREKWGTPSADGRMEVVGYERDEDVHIAGMEELEKMLKLTPDKQPMAYGTEGNTRKVNAEPEIDDRTLRVIRHGNTLCP